MNKLDMLCKALVLSASVAVLSGCETASRSLVEFAEALPDAPRTMETVEAKAPEWVRATGYAPISLQSGQTKEHKMIQAMRASKLRAYQELTAIVHGQYLFGTTAVRDMVVQNDQFKTAVSGIVRGARLVKSYPVQDDVYATVLEVDVNQLQRAWIKSSQ
ncbi:MAG: LPP20 family lipoprotein [Oceanospirillaceae bacterium]|nr:LPP20 family lipoprotein [Oceanospirillaceae bacterium]